MKDNAEENTMGKYEIRKTSNRHYELVYAFGDGTELLKSKLYPSYTNNRKYTGLCYGEYVRFESVSDWKKWCCKHYGK